MQLPMHLRAITMNPKIHDWAKIVNQDNFSIDDFSQIDDFVFLNAGEETRIGRFVHIASFVSVIGGGKLYMGDFSALSAGCRVITGTDDFAGGFLAGPTVPPQYTNIKRAPVHIGAFALIGTNSVIFPGVSVGEGAAVGAGCIVRKNLEPWTVYVGHDCKRIKPREREPVMERARQLFEDLDLRQ